MANLGTNIHGSFSSADASALTEPNGRFSLFAELGASALTLGATDVVVITDVVVASAATLTITIYDGANNAAAAGEIVWKGVVTGNTTESISFTTPHSCQIGTYPKLITSGGGQVDACIKGHIYRKGS